MDGEPPLGRTADGVLQWTRPPLGRASVVWGEAGGSWLDFISSRLPLARGSGAGEGGRQI